MEKSIFTLKRNAVKHDERTRVDLKKRTTENAQLIHDLNEQSVIKKRLLVERSELKAKLQTYEQPPSIMPEESQPLDDETSSAAAPRH